MFIENKEFVMQDKTICDCGYEFILSDINELKRINQSGFYGNIVKHYSHINCPNCNKETLLLLKQKGQTWEILNTATLKQEPTVTLKQENNIDILQEKIVTLKQEQDINTNIPQEQITTDDTEQFICPICKKICKSQIGLNSHIKTHNN